MCIQHNGVWLYQTFFGSWDVIKRCGTVVATNLSQSDAYAMADRIAS